MTTAYDAAMFAKRATAAAREDKSDLGTMARAYLAADDVCEALRAEVRSLRSVLEAANHTLHAHGKIDADTPLHQRIAEASIAER